MALVEDEPRWPWGRINREAARLAGPTGEPASTFRDLNHRHPVVAAFGNRVIEQFLTILDRGSMTPLRARREVGRGHDWGSAFELAASALRDGIADWRKCVHPLHRVSVRDDLGFCRACASWRGSAGAWMPPLGQEQDDDGGADDVVA